MIVTVALLCGLLFQSVAFLWLVHGILSKGAEERRFLINQALASSPQEFAMMAAAARPDETVETLAEARTARPSTPSPLGL